MTKTDTTQHELIQVIPPDYDRRFTYSLKIGDETVFDDGNKLGDNRFQLTDLISKINGKLMRLNNFEREFAGMNPEAVKGALKSFADLVACVNRVNQVNKDNYPHRSPAWAYNHPDSPINVAMNRFLQSSDKARAALAALKESK